MGHPERYLEIEPAQDPKGVPVLNFTDDPKANALLGKDANAFLIGLVLDQQITTNQAFSGPLELRKRLGHLNVKKIAEMPQDDFIEVMCQKPSIHRYCGSMGKRVHDACGVIVEEYGGKAQNIWKGQSDAKTVMKRLGIVPGIGKMKQGLAIMLIARYFDVELEGWQKASPIPVPA